MEPLSSTKEWRRSKAMVEKEAGKRSYVVRTDDGGTSNRNRRQLSLTEEVMKES